MPYLSRRILISLCPLVNLDLFKKGYYHVACRLIDTRADQTLSRVACLEIKDLLGPQLTDFIYPGACQRADLFITQTVLVEYTEQSFSLGECFVFSSDSPILSDYTEVYVPSRYTLQLDLMFSNSEELPKDPSSFTKVSSRSVVFEVDWRKGLHDHYPVIFNYFHMAATGVTIHAALHQFNVDDYPVESLQPSPSTSPLSGGSSTGSGGSGQRSRSSRVSFSGRRLPFQSPPAPPTLPSFSSVLFGIALTSPSASASTNTSTSSTARNGSAAARYVVPEAQIQRAQEAHQMLCDMLRSARDSLHIGYAIMSGEQLNTDPGPEIEKDGIAESTSLAEVEDICQKHIVELNHCLATTWEWFCKSAVIHPQMMTYLASRSHTVKMSYFRDSLVSVDSTHAKSLSNITDPVCQATMASKVRKSLQQIPMPFYCKETVDPPTATSVIFIEPPPWETLSEAQVSSPVAGGSQGHVIASASSPLRGIPGTCVGREGFIEHVKPSLISYLPTQSRVRRRGVHLVICIHGLQGNQFDLRLYRIFLQLALPQVRFEFLMAQSNQSDTFCDFNLMTDRLVEEILEFVNDMPTPPSKVSFIGHSLGNIIIRSLVTRPELAGLQQKLHLFLSICGPHLGTRYQNGIVSMGMWAVRKWFNSKSLLQLSLKDASNARDSFLYHLSEAPSFEYFRHVVLLSSPQDKYVPYHSALIAASTQDGSLQSSLSLEMMQNILTPLREGKVNLVRISVDHSLPASANSVIGRAAHIAMLDSDLFIEKFVTLHLSQYFIEV